MIAALIPALLPVLSKVLGKVLPADPEKKLEMEQALTVAMMQHGHELEQTAASVILAEAKGESWLQRNWRPLLMLVCIAIVANNHLLAPWMAALGLPTTMLDLPPRLWDLMTLGVGGYIAGRSAEKGLKIWKGKE